MILSATQRAALIAYTIIRAAELHYDLGDLVPGDNEVYPVHFRNFIWEAPVETVGVFDIRALVNESLERRVRESRATASVFMHQQLTDVIGGFPFNSLTCLGCGQPLQQINAWMADGCPCNSAGWNNSLNEYRWRLLMGLQQEQARELADIRSRVRLFLDTDGSVNTLDPRRSIISPHHVGPDSVLLELPLQ